MAAVDPKSPPPDDQDLAAEQSRQRLAMMHEIARKRPEPPRGPVEEPDNVHATADESRMERRQREFEVRPGGGPVESAREALKRQSEAELLNEILAGGAVAASLTSAATVAKAKLEATTQRRKNDLDAETERLRIASEERIAGFQAKAAQVGDTEGNTSDA